MYLLTDWGGDKYVHLVLLKRSWQILNKPSHQNPNGVSADESMSMITASVKFHCNPLTPIVTQQKKVGSVPLSSMTWSESFNDFSHQKCPEKRVGKHLAVWLQRNIQISFQRKTQEREGLNPVWTCFMPSKQEKQRMSSLKCHKWISPVNSEPRAKNPNSVLILVRLRY